MTVGQIRQRKRRDKVEVWKILKVGLGEDLALCVRVCDCVARARRAVGYALGAKIKFRLGFRALRLRPTVPNWTVESSQYEYSTVPGPTVGVIERYSIHNSCVTCIRILVCRMIIRIM